MAKAPGPATVIVDAIIRAQASSARGLKAPEEADLRGAARHIDNALSVRPDAASIDPAALDEKIRVAVDAAIEARLDLMTAPPPPAPPPPVKAARK